MKGRHLFGVVAIATSASIACGKVRDDLGSMQDPPGSGEGGRGSSYTDGGDDPGSTGSASGRAGGTSALDSGAPFDPTGSGGDRSTGGTANAGGAATTGGAASTGGVTGAGGNPDVPPDILEEPTVWIGQVEATVTYPPGPGSPDPEKVVLILDAITDAVTGTVSFGEGPPLTGDPSVAYPTWTAPDGSSWPTIADNWNFSPFPGYAYDIVSSELKGNRLSLYFLPAQVFGATCTNNADCGGNMMRKVDLVVTGGTMSGEISRPAGNWLGAVPAIKLKRVQ